MSLTASQLLDKEFLDKLPNKKGNKKSIKGVIHKKLRFERATTGTVDNKPLKWGKSKKKRQIERKRKRIPKKYNVYIKSGYWRERRNKYYQKYGRKCFICKSSRYVQLHHIVYGNFGFEKDENLVLFCRDHHEKFHELYPTKASMVKETLEFIANEWDLERQNEVWK